jgi:signal transduction histidine kinase
VPSGAPTRSSRSAALSRTVDLERSLASTTSVSDAKERFLADWGHELTTPPHAALGLLELIDPVSLSATEQGRLGEVRDDAVTLSGLLNGLVDLAGPKGPQRLSTLKAGGRRPGLTN